MMTRRGRRRRRWTDSRRRMWVAMPAAGRKKGQQAAAAGPLVRARGRAPAAATTGGLCDTDIPVVPVLLGALVVATPF
jgi:hypothetical protein